MNNNNRKGATGVVPPPEIVEAVKRMADEGGDVEAAKRLGVGRGTVRALRGALTVSRGTLALVRERLAGERAS